jgi:hypothetical protein
MTSDSDSPLIGICPGSRHLSKQLKPVEHSKFRSQFVLLSSQTRVSYLSPGATAQFRAKVYSCRTADAMSGPSTRRRTSSNLARSTIDTRPPNPPEPPLTQLHPTVSPSQVDRPLASDSTHIASSHHLRVEPNSAPRNTSTAPDTGFDDLTHDHDHAHAQRPLWQRLLRGIGSGMRNDLRNRAPYYWSDWGDAWNYRVVPATWVSGVLVLVLVLVLVPGHVHFDGLMRSVHGTHT